jgi:phage terminase large subunit-like protein
VSAVDLDAAAGLDERICAWTANCTCAGCKAGESPFTREHFRLWAYELELDIGGRWVVEEFQLAFVEDLFEFVQQEIPAECWLIIPEGNAKTTLTAGLTLYFLEHYPHAGIPVAAPAKETADTLYLQAEGFVVRSPRLSAHFPDVVRINKGLNPRTEVPRVECQEGFRRVKYFMGGRLQIRAADERTADGIIPAGIMVIDELHRLANLGLYRLWTGKGEKRNCPVVVISTAGEPGSEFEDVRTALRQEGEVTREGSFVRAKTETSVLHEWAVPEADHPKVGENIEIVLAANPLSTVTLEKLERKRGKTSWNLAHWRRFTCNIATRSEFAAITEAEWDGQLSEEHEDIPAGERVWVGCDLGWKIDTTAVVPLWWPSDDYRLFGLSRIITPPRDGSSLDSQLVKRAFTDIHERTPIDTVVMDTSDGQEIVEWLENELRVRVIDRQQGNAYAVDEYNSFMKGLREKHIWHVDDPEARRHVLNANGRILPYGDTRFDRPVQSRRSLAQQDRRVIDWLKAGSMVHASAEIELVGGSEPLVAFA